MKGYATQQVAEILGIPPARVRSLARSGFVDPERGPRNEYLFSFVDIVLLRTIRNLREAGISMQRVRRVLELLREQIHSDEPLSALRLTPEGDAVVVKRQDALWDPESGQIHLDFSTTGVRETVEPIMSTGGTGTPLSVELTAEEWYHLALSLEPAADERAANAYRRALRIDPGHVRAHLNLGRLLHERGDIEEAEAHYRRALAGDPESSTAAFNLGVALEDRARAEEAIDAYERALRYDPGLAAAHFNLSRLYEAKGRSTEALRHLADYKRLV